MITRRTALFRLAGGVGGVALADMLARDGLLGADGPGKPGENHAPGMEPREPNYQPKAKAMISMFMHGGPSHVDLFDPKPELQKNHGKDYEGNVGYSFVGAASKKLMGSPFKFNKQGKSGTEISEILPHTSLIADDICVIRSMHTGHNGHEVSIRFFHAGIAGVLGRPTMGSWLTYALGNESKNLPSYMVLSDEGGLPVDGTTNWSSGFMPAYYQGTVLRPKEPRILNLEPPREIQGVPQQRNLTLLRELNRNYSSLHPGEAELESRISGYELAASMQDSAREAFDLSQEPKHILKLYGLENAETRSYGTRCLIARRLVERGVRFVQLFLGGQPWDTHGNLKQGLPGVCRRTDQPAAALVMDLKQRGLLDTTLVHFGGEIGRLPVVQGELNDSAGRDHNGQGFSIWLAGGGIKPGITYGATDEVGHKAAENIVNPNDFQATILHQFGLDHSKLVYFHNGQPQTLTAGKPARVVREILS